MGVGVVGGWGGCKEEPPSGSGIVAQNQALSSSTIPH